MRVGEGGGYRAVLRPAGGWRGEPVGVTEKQRVLMIEEKIRGGRSKRRATVVSIPAMEHKYPNGVGAR